MFAGWWEDLGIKLDQVQGTTIRSRLCELVKLLQYILTICSNGAEMP